jgi:Fic family protein
VPLGRGSSFEKAKFFDRYGAAMNERQLKVTKRLFDSRHQGFKGGLSAENYKKIAKTSASTATRDLKDMVNKAILLKKGVLKSTRYKLNIKHKKTQRISISKREIKKT